MEKYSVLFMGPSCWKFDHVSMNIWAPQIGLGVFFFPFGDKVQRWERNEQ